MYCHIPCLDYFAEPKVSFTPQRICDMDAVTGEEKILLDFRGTDTEHTVMQMGGHTLCLAKFLK